MGSVWLSIATGVVCAVSACAQQPMPAQSMPFGSNPLALPQTGFIPAFPPSGDASLYRDLDLLRRGGFYEAKQATASLKIITKDGLSPGNLDNADYTLIVNGTPRRGRLHPPGSSTEPAVPLVLLVFPPNQPTVHHIGIRAAIKYFSQQPQEILPWRVGIFDSNGTLSAFTNGRSQLLLNLDLIGRTIEPLQYAGNEYLPASQRWDGDWATKAIEAVILMQRFDGPKILLAMNPLVEPMYGNNEEILAHGGPSALTNVAEQIGAHIYIANVGGPDTLPPGGNASTPSPAFGGMSSQMTQFKSALAISAANTSMMMQIAQATHGGFDNSLSDLAAKIHHDLDAAYSLNFDLTSSDRDQGIPSVEVKFAAKNLRVSVLDVAPVNIASEESPEFVSTALMDKVRKATKNRVTSPQFRIAQHVDYFPLRWGVKPVLPLSSLIEWTGSGRGPGKLSIVESIDDASFSTPVIQHAVEVKWDGHRLSWERDGHLDPGQYIWRIAVHDGDGNVFASTEQKIAVDLPRQAPVQVSSLVVGRSCREQEPSASGLRRRHNPNDETQVHTVIDPMRAGDCRIKPEAVARFAPTDLLHAFVRIYPSEKLERSSPESWTARFVLRSTSTPFKTEQEMHFKVDSGSGYLAYIEMPLNTPATAPGNYILDVVMRGPGIRKELKESRPISIQAAADQAAAVPTP